MDIGGQVQNQFYLTVYLTLTVTLDLLTSEISKAYDLTCISETCVPSLSQLLLLLLIHRHYYCCVLCGSHRSKTSSVNNCSAFTVAVKDFLKMQT